MAGQTRLRPELDEEMFLNSITGANPYCKKGRVIAEDERSQARTQDP